MSARHSVRSGGLSQGSRQFATGRMQYFTHPAFPIAGLQEAQTLAVVAPRLVPGIHKHPGAVDVALPVSVSCEKKNKKCICTLATRQVASEELEKQKQVMDGRGQCHSYELTSMTEQSIDIRRDFYTNSKS